MPICGIEKLYVSKQTMDSASVMTFTPPAYYKDVQELDIKPKVNSAKAYAENRLVDQATEFDSADISVSRYSMTSAERAFLLGQTIAAGGGVIAANGDNPPFVALLYKAPIRVNGSKAYRYGVIYKTMFTPPDENLKGLEGKPDLSQVAKISGTAQSTDWSFKDADNNEKHPWEYHIDTTDPNCPADIDATWFTSVPIPSVSAILDLTLASSAPASNAVGVVLTTKPTLTFNNAIANYGNVLLMNTTDGTLVANTMALDATNKILTITPGANLVTAKVYNIILSGITDIYGQVLATQIIKFTAV